MLSKPIDVFDRDRDHEIDIISLARGARPRAAGTPIAFLGEAESRDRRPGMAQL